MGPFFNASPRGALAFATAILLLASTGRTPAQDSVQNQSRPPVHIRAIDGEARLDRDGQADPLPLGMPVIEGDVLSTGSGRIELQTAGGSVLDIDEFSTVEVLDDQKLPDSGRTRGARHVQGRSNRPRRLPPRDT